MTPVSQRTRVIPFAAWVTASIILALMFLLMSWIALREHNLPPGIRILLPVVPSLALSGWTLVIGYIYGDARRRGMRYVMWTLLAIFIPDGIGVILYFILRDPIPGYCTKCGSSTKQGYAFCPRCGANILPVCTQCHRAGQIGWTHCAWCGATL